MFKKEAIPYIFLFVFLSIPIYPQNDTMDVIGWQWVLMAILNLGLFIYTYFNRGISKPKGTELKILIGLFSVMCISILYATNMSLAIQDASRWLQIIIMIWLFGIHFKNKVISYNSLAAICLVFLFIEVNVVLTPLYLELLLNGLRMLNAVSIDSNVFNGITGNKNIAAASIAVKLPLVLYLLNSHKILWRILSGLTGMLSVISILFITARASYISLVCIILCASLYGLFYNKSIKTYYSYLDLGRVFTTFLMCFNIFSLLKCLHKPFRFISYLMIVFLTVEVFYSLNGLLKVFMENSFFIKLTKIDSTVFKGLSANPNITAASLVFKFPFILYFLFQGKSLQKAYIIILSFFYFLLLSFLASRASFLSLLLQGFLFIFFYRKKYKSVLKVAIMLLIPFLASYLYVEVYNKIPNGIDQLASIRIENDSSSNRFYLWSHTIDYLMDHPFGCGFGNWKIESIPYWKDMGSSYQVPYHAHNDFLEIFAETGFLGGFAYLFIFIFILFNLIKKLINKVPLMPFIFLLFVSYSIDAFFNFPLERTVMQFLFSIMFVLSLLPLYNEK